MEKKTERISRDGFVGRVWTSGPRRSLPPLINIIAFSFIHIFIYLSNANLSYNNISLEYHRFLLFHSLRLNNRFPNLSGFSSPAPPTFNRVPVYIQQQEQTLLIRISFIDEPISISTVNNQIWQRINAFIGIHGFIISSQN